MRGTAIPKALFPAENASPNQPCTSNQRSESSVRILVVDDYKEVRQLVCVVLATRQDSRIVGEASDGLEAVHKAKELKPDLIVLDIDLPSRNGIEAARQILANSRHTLLSFKDRTTHYLHNEIAARQP